MIPFGKKEIIGIVVGLILILFGFIFLRGTNLFPFILVISLVIVASPFVLSVVLSSEKEKEKEKRFLDFVRDLVENVKTGTPVNRSISNIKSRDYGPLNPHITKLANQLNLGIPLTQALLNFGKDTKSKVISRSLNLIAEAERAGGDIGQILESVAESVNQSEELKKEQKSSVYNLVVQGYIIFIVFIIIMLVLQFYILPLLDGIGGIGDLGGTNVNSISSEEFSRPLFFLLIVQSIFAGLVIGKISEGSIKDGVKHSFILTAMTLLITTGANAFF